MYINEGQLHFLAFGAAHGHPQAKVLEMHSTRPDKNPSFYSERARRVSPHSGKRVLFRRSFAALDLKSAGVRYPALTISPIVLGYCLDNQEKE
jgi:hypothetical protein